MKTPGNADGEMNDAMKVHVSVCICTFKRPALLKRTLEKLTEQQVRENVSFSIVVADNDQNHSAEVTVSAFREASRLEVVYCVEPRQNIALARNKALEHARGDFAAFIDDDELPAVDWMQRHLEMFADPTISGSLGPVRPFFDDPPPHWLVQGRFCERAEYATGLVLNWRQTRTGNVMFRRAILNGLEEPFRQVFGNGGEDQDFFKRMIENTHRFVWCNEAVVHEIVPPERWKRRYMFKRAFLRGQNERQLLSVRSVAISLIAFPIYSLMLPILLLTGQALFVRYAIRLLDHLGKLVAVFGFRPLGNKYLNG